MKTPAISTSRASRLAWSLCAVSVTLLTVALVFELLDRNVPDRNELQPLVDAVVTVALLSFPVVGAMIASRQPRNSIGWLFCVVGVPFGLSVAANGWAAYTLFENPGSLPAGEVAAWLGGWIFAVPLFAVPAFLFLLFPDGRPPTRRWRPVGWLTAAGLVGITLGSAFAPGRLEEPPFKDIENPAGIEGAEQVTDVVGAGGFIALFFAVLLGAAALVGRFRRARGDERQQLKWFASAGVLFALAVVLAASPWFGSSDTVGQALILLAFACIPVTAGVAILKHRLYDIDVVINRTLVYGSLTALLAATYLGSVLLLQLALRPLTSQSNLAIAGSTLAVAALFRPARARIQSVVDRRFYRRKYDAAQTLEGFSARLRDEVDLDTLGAELRGVVAETMQPAHVSLWLRGP
jgi:MFS family permease